MIRLFRTRIGGGRRPDELWRHRGRRRSSGRHLCRKKDPSRGGGMRAYGAPTGADHKGEAFGAARVPQTRRGMNRCVTNHWPAQRRTTREGGFIAKDTLVG